MPAKLWWRICDAVLGLSFKVLACSEWYEAETVAIRAWFHLERLMYTWQPPHIPTKTHVCVLERKVD